MRPIQARQPLALPPTGTYTVGSGDTLYGIASRYGLDFRQVGALNGISPPYLIYPGQRLRLAASHPAGPPSAEVATPAESRSSSRLSPPETETPTSADARGGDPSLAWSWPAHGRVVRRFAQGGSKGIDIRSKPGAPVRAAAAGRVVYSGSGLAGYGKLIIVKHNNTYLSAYGHNDRVLVKEGDPVAGGQRIAYLGRSGADGVRCHFEIRRNGKPVDPLGYLPSPSPPKEDSDA